MRDVKVTVIEKKHPCNRNKIGDWFVIKGDKVHAPLEMGICFYSLSAMMPALAAWEMEKGSNDHYVMNLTRFTCPMGATVYQAEQIEDFKLE
jgi:uncharacterized repeat protein (TIGR04076 family)